MTGLSEGDSACLAALFVAVAPDLHAHALVLTQGQRHMAEDLVQDAFVAAAIGWTKLRTRDDEGRRRWLFTVLGNKVVDRWRKEWRVHYVPDVEDAADPPVADETHDQVAGVLAAAHCWKILRDMPAVRYRIAVFAWHFHWTREEIAQHLNLKPSTVRVQLSRARRELHDQLGPGRHDGREGRDR